MGSKDEPRRDPGKEDDDGWLGTATKVAGLLAGAVALVYMLGGVVIALRLLMDGFSPSGSVTLLAEMSRELVISTAMLEVIGPAATIGLIAAVIYGAFDLEHGHERVRAGWAKFRGRPSRPAVAERETEEKDVDKGDGEGRLSKPQRLAAALWSIVLSAGALLAAAGTEARWLLVFAAIVSALVTFGLTVAGWRYLRTDHYKDRTLPGRTAAVAVAVAGMALMPAVLLSAALLEFEEVQVCTTDSADPSEGILLGNLSDRVLVAVDVWGEESILSYPADRVAKTEYGDLSTEFPCRPESPDAAREAAAATAELGGHGSDVERELAMRLRPWLQFDSEEPWRPLTVEALVDEELEDGRHRVCGRGEMASCERFAELDDLGPEAAYVDIDGDGPNGQGFAAPDELCKGESAAVDCDGGAGSAIYYRRTSHRNRWYWDYWWFFRYSNYTGKLNRCRFICGDHEGDWEGMTVITTASTEPRVTGAIYAAHGARVMVGAAALSLVGKHPRAFVAKGTHATYPFACRGSCRQHPTLGLFGAGIRIYEESHDGEAGWTHNGDESCEATACVRPLPEGGGGEEGDSLPVAGEWAAWGGRWGATCPRGCDRIGPKREPSPRSPGSQNRFRCPWIPNIRAAPQVGRRGLLHTRRVGDKRRLLAACAAQHGRL